MMALLENLGKNEVSMTLLLDVTLLSDNHSLAKLDKEKLKMPIFCMKKLICRLAFESSGKVSNPSTIDTI
jgi:hypothetical protein